MLTMHLILFAFTDMVTEVVKVLQKTNDPRNVITKNVVF